MFGKAHMSRSGVFNRAKHETQADKLFSEKEKSLASGSFYPASLHYFSEQTLFPRSEFLSAFFSREIECQHAAPALSTIHGAGLIVITQRFVLSRLCPPRS